MPTNITPPRIPMTQEEEDLILEGTDAEETEVPVVVEGDYNPILHTVQTLPVAVGSIPPTFTSITMAEQRATASEFHGFLTSVNPQLIKLNEGTKVYTALVSIPKS